MRFESREICERSATVVNPYLNRFDWGFPYKRRTQETFAIPNPAPQTFANLDLS